jgi:uncharacterized protein YndB with AHSA1/START domain
MAKTRAFEFERLLRAPAAEVYRAFTNAMALREWLCDTADVDPRKGGRIYLWWHSGYYTHGEYTALAPGRKIALTWHGRGEPAPTAVRVSLAQRRGATVLHLTHDDIGSGKAWARVIDEFTSGWEVLLENLQSVLETGIDLRVARRPMLGITFGEPLTPDLAAALGVPVKDGFRIDGVLEGMGAQAAGLQKDDVFVSFEGRRISGYPALLHRLQQHRAGDCVKVVFYRGDEKRSASMELSPRPLPEIPTTPLALAEVVRDLYAQAQAALSQCLKGMPEDAASTQPAPGEWSARDTLAHLVATERDTITWMAGLIADDESNAEFYGNLPARISALTAVYPTVDALLEQLDRCQEETVAVLSALPETFVAHRGSYWRLGYRLLSSARHTDEHLEQIRAALASVP